MSTAKKINIETPNIFESHDYREFLIQWFNYLKQHHSISMRTISTASRLAVGYLPMVLSGKRPLTDKVLNDIQPHIHMDNKAFDFLKCLRDLNEANSQEKMANAYSKITSFSQYKKENNKELEAHKLLSAWYYTAILEMAKSDDFKLDAKHIQRQLKRKVPIKSINLAIEFLLQAKFIKSDLNGKVTVLQKSLECHGGVFKISMGEFHRQMLELATESIHNTDREHRNLVTHTMAISEEQINEVNQVLNEALDKIKKIGDQTNKSDEVYQISLLNFPLTNSKGNKDD